MDSVKSKEKYYSNPIPKDVLDDICCRFIINMPQELKGDNVRMCFEMEQAYWFYLDFYCGQNENLVRFGMKDFCIQVFSYIPSMNHFVKEIDNMLDEWRQYKQNVPTFGAILIDESLTHVLLVQSYHSKVSWGFPKGKINQQEQPSKCAIREVLEETGFDISNYIEEDNYAEFTHNDQLTRLYFAPGVPFHFKFEPKTRCEIKSCKWFPIHELPTGKLDGRFVNMNGMQLGPNSFFMVMPFVKRIKRFIQQYQKKKMQHKIRTPYKSLSDVESSFERFPSGTKSYKCMDLEEAMMQRSKASASSEKKSRKSLFSEGPVDNYCLQPILVPSDLQSKYSPQPQKLSKMLKTKGQPITIAAVEDIENPYYPKAWREFKFDVDALMKCFY